MVIIMFKTKRKKLSFLLSSMLGSLVMLFAGSASAATYVPAIVGTAFGDITTDFNTLVSTYIWPLLILVLATFFMMRIVKRGAGSAG
jgi:hypothetical protein